MKTFDELARSRRQWIDTTLRPWCETAARSELVQAEIEWENIAGRVDPQSTLWTWAWSRFPHLVHEGLPSVNETAELTVTLQDGKIFTGYPNAQATHFGKLILQQSTGNQTPPLSIDDITTVIPA